MNTCSTTTIGFIIIKIINFGRDLQSLTPIKNYVRIMFNITISSFIYDTTDYESGQHLFVA